MRPGVALLLTLVIVMLMSIVIGLGMSNLQEAKTTVEKERFMIQSGMLVQDVLHLLKSSPQIDAIVESNSSALLTVLLDSTSMLPFSSQGYRVMLSLSSARDRLNINTFAKHDTRKSRQRRAYLANFLNSYGLGNDLYDFILDAMGGMKADGSYRSDLFFLDPTLYRDAIVSPRQMERILLLYAKKDGKDPFSKLDFDKIFCYNEDNETKLDLNHATPEAWEFVTGVSKERAKELAENAGVYEKLDDLRLSPEQKESLSLFDYSFFEPVLRVHIEVANEKLNAAIEFEYDLRKKKAKRFAVEIQN